MKIQAILVASVSLALWGCGSESGGDGDPQSELADLLVDEESTITEDAVSNGTDATETTISDDGIEAPTETGPVAETTAAPAGASSVEVIESTKSLPISVDVGGAAPTDPFEIEFQQELDGYLSANGIPTDQAALFAHFGADRWAHLFIENATIRYVSTQWSLEEDGAGDVAVNISYGLDRAGLDEAAVADAIESAMTEAGLERTVRQDIEEGVSSDVKLQFGSNAEDHFTVRVSGPDDDVPDPTTLVIGTTARFADVAPQLIAVVAPLGPTLDQIDPDGPITRIEADASNNTFPYVVREIERLTTVDPAEFDAYVPTLDAASAEIYGTDRVQEKIEDDLARFQYLSSRVEASIEDEGVVLLLVDAVWPD